MKQDVRYLAEYNVADFR